jgi:hypothetical protein
MLAGVLGGECAMALAAGVNAMLSPRTAIKISQLQVTPMLKAPWSVNQNYFIVDTGLGRCVKAAHEGAV